MFALLYTDGQLRVNDVIKECITQKWVPLFVFRNISDSVLTLPIFDCPNLAKSFMKRNLPKSWCHGSILLSDCDRENMISKGWNLQTYTFPNKISDRRDIQLGFEIFELDESPEFMTTRL